MIRISRGISFALAFNVTISGAQTGIPDTSFVAEAQDYARAVYHGRVFSQSGLYNGRVYKDYTPVRDEHPFFISENLVDGSVVFDGVHYQHALLLYDISKDKIITEHPRRLDKLELLETKVDEFIIHDCRFVNFTGDNHPETGNGYFEVAYENEVAIYLKHEKKIDEKMTHEGLSREFVTRVTYYIRKGSTLHRVKSRRSALRVFNEHKNQIKRHLRSRGILFGVDRKRSLVEMAFLYDSLNSNPE